MMALRGLALLLLQAAGEGLAHSLALIALGLQVLLASLLMPLVFRWLL
jgi:hypothetical protein